LRIHLTQLEIKKRAVHFIPYRAAISSKAKINGSIDVEIYPFTLKSLKTARPTNFIGHI
jgi:hypothetical protein